jgi:hypothetical protein
MMTRLLGLPQETECRPEDLGILTFLFFEHIYTRAGICGAYSLVGRCVDHELPFAYARCDNILQCSRRRIRK